MAILCRVAAYLLVLFPLFAVLMFAYIQYSTSNYKVQSRSKSFFRDKGIFMDVFRMDEDGLDAKREINTSATYPTVVQQSVEAMVKLEFAKRDDSMAFLKGAMSQLLARDSLDYRQLLKVKAPLSLLYPCAGRDVHRIHQVLKSISQQTVLPNETIIAISVGDKVDNELDWEFFGAYGIPNLRIYIRGGERTTGSNRQFLMDRASSEIVSFCDCDDYIHPQRTEILSRLFVRFPEVEAMIHAYEVFHRDSRDTYDASTLASRVYKAQEIESWAPPRPFKEIWNHDSVEKYSDKKWVPGDPSTEPNHPDPRSKVWWFPAGFNYPLKHSPHNAWVTLRTETARQVPYPDLSFGEDSLYNWRLLKSHHNWTYLDMVLGGYVRPYEPAPN